MQNPKWKSIFWLLQAVLRTTLRRLTDHLWSTYLMIIFASMTRTNDTVHLNVINPYWYWKQPTLNTNEWSVKWDVINKMCISSQLNLLGETLDVIFCKQQDSTVSWASFLTGFFLRFHFHLFPANIKSAKEQN